MKDYRILIADLWAFLGSRLVLLIVVMTLAGLAEGLAVALLLPLLVSLGVAGTAATGPLGDILFGMVRLIGSGWTGLIALITVVALVQGGLVLAQGWLAAAYTQSYMAHWKMRLMRAFLHADWPLFFERKVGDMISAITNETGRLSAAAMNLFNLVAAVVVGTIYLAYGFALSAEVTGSVLLLAAVLVLTLGRLYRRSFSLGVEVGPLLSEQQVLIGEFLQGAKAVKAAAMEERAAARLAVVVAGLERANRMSGFLPYVVRAVFETGGLIALIALLVFAVTWVHAPLANLLVVLALFVRLFPRISSLQQYVHSLNAFIPSVSLINALAHEAETRRERFPETEASKVDIPFPAKLSLRQVSVRLSGTKVLDRVSFDMQIPGITAVVGESGAGKSTLLSSLLRLVPADGQILLNERPIAEFPLAGWRRAIGFVPQEPILFHASIRDNLIFVRPDAREDEIVDAARRAQLDSLVRDLPGGYDTIIGDQGVRLSGGQRQRVGLARALLGKPRILILDEATSALDSVTESAVLDALDSLRDEMGILIVAHRLASVRRADRIIVLDRGRIAESGAWNYLMKQAGQFHALASAQHVEAIP